MHPTHGRSSGRQHGKFRKKIRDMPNHDRQYKVSPQENQKQISRAISRVLSLDDHLSRAAVADSFKRRTWKRIGPIHGFHFGLASDRVCMAPHITARTVVSYTAFSPLPFSEKKGGMSLLHCPGSRLRRPLTGILPFEARTFLTPAWAGPRSSALLTMF